MSKECSNTERLIINAWGILGKNSNSDKTKRLFCISKNLQNSTVHILAYYESDWTPQRVFNGAFNENKTGFPFVEIAELNNGDAVITHNGKWRRNPEITPNLPVKFKLSSGDQNEIEKFKDALVKSAKAYLKEFFKHDPDVLYDHFVKKDEVRRIEKLEEKKSKSRLQNTFSLTARLLPEWHVDFNRRTMYVKMPPSSPRLRR